jgi:hypothetical protein
MVDPAISFFTQCLNFSFALLSTAMSVLGFLSQILTSVSFILFLLTTSAIMYPVAVYHDQLIEEGEWFMRTVVYPFYRDFARPAFDFIRILYNNFVCWFNAVQYWLYGMIYKVFYPTFRDCDIKPVTTAAYNFLVTLFNDFFLNYFLTERFFYGPCDFSNITATGITAWLAWVDLYTCTCSDLADILGKLPIFPGFIPVLGLTSWFSLQWADPLMWEAMAYFVNGFMEVLNQLLRLAIQGLQSDYFNIDVHGEFARENFTRPDFYLATSLL